MLSRKSFNPGFRGDGPELPFGGNPFILPINTSLGKTKPRGREYPSTWGWLR